MLEREAGPEDESAALSDDSLGGGVGGFSIGVRPLASERWGSRRICVSATDLRSTLTRAPDTVDVRFGLSMGSGMYSLTLLFLVCVCGFARAASSWLSGAASVAAAGAGQDVSPA